MKISEIIEQTSTEVKELENKIVIVTSYESREDGFEIGFKPMINIGSFVENKKPSRYSILLQDLETDEYEFLSERESIILLKDTSSDSLKDSISKFIKERFKTYLPEELNDFEAGKHSVLIYEDAVIKCIKPVAFNAEKFVLKHCYDELELKSFNDENVYAFLNNTESLVEDMLNTDIRLQDITKGELVAE